MPRSRFAGNADRRVAVVTRQLGRALDPAGFDKGRERDHLAQIVAHIHFEQVLDLAPLVAFSLNHYPLHAALIREVVDIGRAHGR